MTCLLPCACCCLWSQGRRELPRRLHFKITDAERPRWEVPNSLIKPSDPEPGEAAGDLYTFSYPHVGEPFSLTAGHRNRTPSFDTQGLDFRYKDQ